MGTAPYDAVSFIISTHLPNVSFRVIRIVYDFAVTAIAVLLGGKLGIVTVPDGYHLRSGYRMAGKYHETASQYL